MKAITKSLIKGSTGILVYITTVVSGRPAGNSSASSNRRFS